MTLVQVASEWPSVLEQGSTCTTVGRRWVRAKLTTLEICCARSGIACAIGKQAQPESQNADTGDGIWFLNTVLKKVALVKEWWTAAANKYTDGQGWYRKSLKWNRAGTSETADKRERESTAEWRLTKIASQTQGGLGWHQTWGRRRLLNGRNQDEQQLCR